MTNKETQAIEQEIIKIIKGISYQYAERSENDILHDWISLEHLTTIILYEAKNNKKNYMPLTIKEIKKTELVKTFNNFVLDFDLNKIDLNQDYKELNYIGFSKFEKKQISESIIYNTLSFLKTPDNITNDRNAASRCLKTLFSMCQDRYFIKKRFNENRFEKFFTFIQIINIAINYINNDK